MSNKKRVSWLISYLVN